MYNIGHLHKKFEPHPVYFPPTLSFFGGVLFVLVVVVVDEIGPLEISSGATFGVLARSIVPFTPAAALPAFALNDDAASLGRISLL